MFRTLAMAFIATFVCVPAHAQIVRFVTVEKNVTLEVLDWGGSGRPMIFLAGQGVTAQGFQDFAPRFTSRCHVYSITRRGYGASSWPEPTSTNYAADRLGDDVLAVMDSLHLNRPVLVGHSLGGEELSSVGSRHPEKVAGLIYLDAGYNYAYYDSSRGNLNIDVNEARRRLEQLGPGNMPRDLKPLIRELLDTSLPALEKDLRQMQKNLETMGDPRPSQQQPEMPLLLQAISAGMQKYTDIRVPILAIFAVPHFPAAGDMTKDSVATEGQAKAFETGLPSARVVRLSHANHFIYQSNAADVWLEMQAFLSGLP